MEQALLYIAGAIMMGLGALGAAVGIGLVRRRGGVALPPDGVRLLPSGAVNGCEKSAAVR